MDLQTILKNYLEDDEKVVKFLEEMKNNKIYTASQENMDVRYKKLQDDFNAKDLENQEATKLIETLKKDSAGNEALQGKIKEYEEKIADLEEKNQSLQIESAVKVKLLEAKAKPEDIKYLMFQMKENNDKELRLDDNGELRDFDSILESLKTSYPNNFEATSKKSVEELLLPTNDNSKNTITKDQFNKMSYKEKIDLLNKDPETYNTLRNL